MLTQDRTLVLLKPDGREGEILPDMIRKFVLKGLTLANTHKSKPTELWLKSTIHVPRSNSPEWEGRASRP